MPGFDPGRALARPTGEFVLLRDVRLSVRARPEVGRRDRRPRAGQPLRVERVRADLMLGFFFPGAVVDPIGTAGGLA